MNNSTDELDFDTFRQHYQKVPVEEYPNNVLEAVPEPMVSVHVSTYQHADFIRDCLDGVVMQETDFPMEIIIGEDESDDGTREICKEYADRYPDKIRLFLHRRENNISINGQPTGRFQFVYSHFVSRGRYLAICEGDDYWTDPTKLQKQISFLESNPEYVLSHHDSLVVNSEGKKIQSSRLSRGDKKDFEKNELIRGPFLLTLTVCFRNVINKYPKKFFGILNADLFLISILGQHGRGHYQENVSPGVYRKHEGGMWSSLSKMKSLKSHVNTYQRLHEYYNRIENREVSEYFLKSSIYNIVAIQEIYLENEKYREALDCSFRVLNKCIKNTFVKPVLSMFIGVFFALLGNE